MNKKGLVYQFGITVILLVTLTSMFLVVRGKGAKFEKENVGERELNLIKAYQNVEFKLLYMDVAARVHLADNVNKLASFGGHSGTTECLGPNGLRLWTKKGATVKDYKECYPFQKEGKELVSKVRDMVKQSWSNSVVEKLDVVAVKPEDGVGAELKRAVSEDFDVSYTEFDGKFGIAYDGEWRENLKPVFTEVQPQIEEKDGRLNFKYIAEKPFTVELVKEQEKEKTLNWIQRKITGGDPKLEPEQTLGKYSVKPSFDEGIKYSFEEYDIAKALTSNAVEKCSKEKKGKVANCVYNVVFYEKKVTKKEEEPTDDGLGLSDSPITGKATVDDDGLGLGDDDAGLSDVGAGAESTVPIVSPTGVLSVPEGEKKEVKKDVSNQVSTKVKFLGKDCEPVKEPKDNKDRIYEVCLKSEYETISGRPDIKFGIYVPDRSDPDLPLAQIYSPAGFDLGSLSGFLSGTGFEFLGAQFYPLSDDFLSSWGAPLQDRFAGLEIPFVDGVTEQVQQVVSDQVVPALTSAGPTLEVAPSSSFGVSAPTATGVLPPATEIVQIPEEQSIVQTFFWSNAVSPNYIAGGVGDTVERNAIQGCESQEWCNVLLRLNGRDVRTGEPETHVYPVSVSDTDIREIEQPTSAYMINDFNYVVPVSVER